MSTIDNQKTYKLEQFGTKIKRRNYSNAKTELPLTNLVAVQRESYEKFLNEGLEETLNVIYPIQSTNEKIKIEYVKDSLRLEKPEDEFEAIRNAKQKGMTYNVKVFAKLRKISNETGEVKEQEVLFSEIPLMTQGANFLINGSTKVIVSQLIRSPGAHFESLTRKGSDKDLYNKLEIIPKLGMWISIFHKATKEKADAKVSIDKSNVSLSTFLRAFGMKKETIKDLFGSNPVILETIAKDKKASEIDSLDYIHGILKRGDRITDESRRNLFSNFFFNKRRYDLSKTGRYLMNKKLGLVERIVNTFLAFDLKTSSGKVLFKKGISIDFETATDIQEAFKDGALHLTEVPDIDPKYVYGRQGELHPELLEKNKIAIINVFSTREDLEASENIIQVIGNDPSSTDEHLLISDIAATVSYYFNLLEGIGDEDDTDSLVNKRIVTIGELLQNQFQIALTRLERSAKERMSANDPEKITPKNIINNKIVYNQFKSFFNSSQLSQFMDQVNPLAEIANKRRVTSLGPGGLNRETAIVEVRDVHSTHYGRLCPIESPEGPNIGLILNFATYARVNSYGFIETPYFKVKNSIITDEVIYMQASEEKNSTFAQSSINIDDNNKIVDKEVVVRRNGDYVIIDGKDVNYVDVSSKQMTSISSSCIPFLENDDANRALMGANMMRQAVPLIQAETPYVATGSEADVAKFSATNIISAQDGVVEYVDSIVVKIKAKDGKKHNYYLRTFERSNQGTIITQKPTVKTGQKVKKGDILCDGTSFDNGELAVGKNVVVAFTTWNGYNYEDAVIVSERLVKDDVYTSIHIEEQTIKFRKAKAGDDELATEIPNVSNFAKRNLDTRGIIIIGSEVQAGDVLVGRISPKTEDNPSPEEKLMAAIFSEKVKNVRDTSLKVKHGHGGTIIDVQTLSREEGDKIEDEVWMMVKVFIAQKRKIKVGDKMSGRHGNKGVISRVLPIEDMPHLADGTPVDIMLNPQGVPSRMNIGQVLEMHLGLAAKYLNTHFVTPIFNGIKFPAINDVMEEAGLNSKQLGGDKGKFDLYDPTSGKTFDSKICVGVMYMLKLNHMIDDKMHARSVGPYSLITQQPLGGKSQNGGQRFGEMEAWSIESYGAANVLQELLTYKSDNIDGRNKLYNAISSGTQLPRPGTPESFSVLAYELRGLGLKLGVEVKEGDDND